MPSLIGNADDGTGYAVKGENTNNPPIQITGRMGPVGVWGDAPYGNGVVGTTTNRVGVFASAAGTGTAVEAVSQSGIALYADSATGAAAVEGHNPGTKSLAVLAGRDRVFQQHAGVYGESDQQGVFGNSTSASGTGVYGIANSGNGFGVRGESKDGTAIQGQCFGNGIAVLGKGGRVAGRFEGAVEITGDLNTSGNHNCKGDIFLAHADCAEEFNVSGVEPVEPGTVMVINNEDALEPSRRAYDKRVAGIISGAGGLQPGIVLDRQVEGSRSPIALIGKVYCKVDADFGAIEVGDLLTTSPTCGHAMKASDPANSFGAVIGKALRPMASGRGLVPVLVSLQ
jgi:hypothetical protein